MALQLGGPPLPAGVLTIPPADANTYERVCLRPLPSNTQIIAVVNVGPALVDFYYSQTALPGAVFGNRKWVCRTQVYDPRRPSTKASAGKLKDKVERIDSAKYDPKPATGIPNALSGFSKGAAGSSLIGAIASGLGKDTLPGVGLATALPSVNTAGLKTAGYFILGGLALVAVIFVARAFD